jgi:hypothetical protein
LSTVSIPPHDRRDRYFLKPSVLDDNAYQEVTLRQFIQAERSAGFRPKGGGDGPATGGFSGGGVSGRMQTEWSFDGGQTWERADLAYARFRENA